MKGLPKQQLDGLTALLNVAYEYAEKVDNYSASSLPDEAIQVSINGKGKITNCEMRQGLQHELTAPELSEAFTDAINAMSRQAEEEGVAMLDDMRKKSQAIASKFEHSAEYGAALASLGGFKTAGA
ncbi:Uncharacterised protein [Mycobacteroides abscessus subsp. abscessus]|uniref:hypothetical protein n=1 Tax=Mycobacteroides abscessus TaxID=36809 RepID=UPI00092BDE75|nr:hypothetical protein [Mycobacteroides abscessus]SHS17591.1 Uncharacterised protein [Mycobacteroides abscessus subsp. abscessus]SKO02912.1 Uncharacterised protein [Mycobacteroides abscessus subsp. massiliense]SKO10627.1 Uncharacterised protein [Mycobacteroides abscessus subsp. massiliense]